MTQDRLPGAFVEAMQAQLGPEWFDFEQSLAEVAPVSLHYNHRKAGETPLFSGTEVPWNPSAIYLEERPVFTLDPHFHAGRYYVQEAGSMLLVPVLQQIQAAANRPFRRALDLCGAPGGKTTLLLNYLPDDCLVVANEVIKSRYAILRENLMKWGRANIITTQGDSNQFSSLSGIFDLVLVDAPCSGEGLFRKNPRARAEWSPDHVQLCASRQRRILHNAMELVREGGFLIYSTCTYNSQENDDNVNWICEQGDFEVFSLSLPEKWGVVDTKSGHQCYPHRTRSEGFYISVLQKTGASKKPAKVRPLRYFSATGKAVDKLSAHWLSPNGDWQVLTDPQEELYCIDKRYLNLLARLSHTTLRMTPGTPLGVLKGRDLIPAHALALSVEQSTAISGIEVERAAALAFLRKQELKDHLDTDRTGWQLIRYHGYGLGWVKVLPRRINNYLPKQYRIRMA
jgi:16S rRNA C967 or C1407 C5-methylase (RsmB/RsmF family)/NOL1/NOP2/fmu family ribosome biogenesis protein